MELSFWLSLFSICLLGAMSPGPSLAVVMRSTLHGGHSAGYASAIAHGFGVALYGLLTVAGLAVVLTRTPAIYLTLQFLGALYLLYLGIKSLRRSSGPALTGNEDATSHSPIVSGFLVAFLNPKLAIFMLALFSQFLRPESGWEEKWIMVATVGITDMCWYAVVATLISRKSFLARLRNSAAIIDRVFGVILILLASTVMWHVLTRL
ncbi:MAG: LysE family translocator [Halioglobus sp.]